MLISIDTRLNRQCYIEDKSKAKKYDYIPNNPKTNVLYISVYMYKK